MRKRPVKEDYVNKGMSLTEYDSAVVKFEKDTQRYIDYLEKRGDHVINKALDHLGIYYGDDNPKATSQELIDHYTAGYEQRIDDEKEDWV